MANTARSNHHCNQVAKPSVSESAIEIVKCTWQLVKKDPIKHGLVFYHRMFTEHPEVRPLFSFSSTLNEGDIKSNVHVQKQATKLTNMISYAVDALNDLAHLSKKLKKSGAKHFVEYKVKPEHFQVVGACLLWTLEQGLGDIYTREVHEAWTTVYGLMSDLMIEGGKEAMTDVNGNAE